MIDSISGIAEQRNNDASRRGNAEGQVGQRHAWPDRLVPTVLDETDTLAPLVSVLSDDNLPVSYLLHGQNVPDDLQRATPAALTDWVLGETIGGACA